MKRGLLNRDVHKELEFIVEYKEGDKSSQKPLDFTLTPENLQTREVNELLPSLNVATPQT